MICRVLGICGAALTCTVSPCGMGGMDELACATSLLGLVKCSRLGAVRKHHHGGTTTSGPPHHGRQHAHTTRSTIEAAHKGANYHPPGAGAGGRGGRAVAAAAGAAVVVGRGATSTRGSGAASNTTRSGDAGAELGSTAGRGAGAGAGGAGASEDACARAGLSDCLACVKG
jgi:hypothetical protein